MWRSRYLRMAGLLVCGMGLLWLKGQEHVDDWRSRSIDLCICGRKDQAIRLLME